MKNYKVGRIHGRAVTVYFEDNGKAVHIPINSNHSSWKEFLEWNANQPQPLDLSDREPDPPPRDTDREQIETILAKTDGDITPAEFKAVMLRLARRLLAKGR